MIVRIPIEIEQKGSGAKGVIADLERIEDKGRKAGDALGKSSKRGAEFADTMGKMSTTLARSADAFGLNAQAFRVFDDVMDVTELGLKNLTKTAVGFNAATFAVAAAAGAVGYALGSWIAKIPAVQKAMDSLTGTIYRLTQSQADLDKQFNATHGLKEFQAQMRASNEDALRKQIQSMREQGKSVKDIAAFYKGNLNPELKERLGLSEKAVKAEEAILRANQKQKDELAEIQRLFRGQPRGLVEGYKAATSVDLKKDLMLGGLATDISDSRRGGVSASAQIPMSQLMGGGLATSISLTYSQERDLERKSTEAAAEAGRRLVDTLGTLSQNLTNLGHTVGGVAGKILGLAGSVTSGIGGVMSGIQGFRQAGQVGGLLGTLGKVASGLGIAGSIVGAVGGLISGFKSLFGGKSKEQKAAEEAQRKQAEADRKAAEEERKRITIEGLKSARSAAESIMDRMSSGEFSEKLAGSLGVLVGKVQEALGKAGLGFMATGPLRDSKEFKQAQGLGEDVASLVKGMREGGALDAGVMGAVGGARDEIQSQAVAAAEAAGLAPAEATKAGFGAIAPILREQLNAAMASGVELDANTKALIEEAKKNGINIVADPMIESVAVQKDMLKELRDLNRSGGGVPDESFASGTRGLRLVKRDMLARIHEGEGMLVVTKDEMSRMSFGSFAKGSDDDRDWPNRDPRDVPMIPAGTSGSTSGGDSGGGVSTATVEAAVAAALERVQTVQVVNAPTVNVVDQSAVRTVEGQKAFERETIGAITRALDQNNAGLEARIERIAKRVA